MGYFAGPGLTFETGQVSSRLSGTTQPSASKAALTAVITVPVPSPAALSCSST